MKRTHHFLEGSYRKNAWTTAIKAASLPYRTPYSLRHSFAAWALTINADKNMLVARMGHSSKKMVYEVYSEYVEGLQKDREQILAYLGEDFLG